MTHLHFSVFFSALLSIFHFWTDENVKTPLQLAEEEEICVEDTLDIEKSKSKLALLLTPPDSNLVPPDSLNNPYNHQGDATHDPIISSPFDPPKPSNIETKYELAPDGKGYYIYERVGGVDIKPPSYMTFDEYIKYRREKTLAEYAHEQALQNNKEVKAGLIPSFDLGAVTDVFGGGPVEIKPTGSASLQFALNRNKTANPNLSIRQQKNQYFDFDQQIQVGVQGQIGNKMKLNINQDTKATFDFENLMKLDYTGDEDQIIQRLASGNIQLQTGNSLIQGSNNLFGVLVGTKWGPVNVSFLGAMQRGQKQSINVKSGAIETPFKKKVADYDANRHYFLSHYFRSKYDEALSRLPQINSRIRINQVEVWVTNPNLSQTANLRPGIGFMDLGENELPIANGQGNIFNEAVVKSSTQKRYPDKACNDLYSRLIANAGIRDKSQSANILETMNLTNGVDFQLVNLRKLQETKDYTVQNQLGYISLNSPLQSDDVLFVSFSYTIDGVPYQVGEFSNDIPANQENSNPLFLKMLRPSQLRPTYNGEEFPAWDLMMKNIYSISYGLKPDGFKMDIYYESGTNAGKIRALQQGAVKNVPLIQVTNLDQLTNNTAPSPDNIIDFIEGLTVLSDKGYIIFPVIEPFGSHLAKKLLHNADDSARFVFQPLYDMTYQDAIQKFQQLDRYTLEGTYSGANNSEIPLNAFGVTPQSVKVTANGVTLVQGTDYEVDPSGGKVIIKNPAYMAPGQDIKVDVEQQQMYQMQMKTMTGIHADMNLTPKIKLGASALRLNERPTTFKVPLGDEPINNTLVGMNTSGQTESKFLTKMIDKLPLISTKAPSNLNFSGEVAYFIPGQPKQVKLNGENGTIYLDDFEAAKQPYNMMGTQNWKLASFPKYLTDEQLYDYSNHLTAADSFAAKWAKGMTRAKLAWYQIDPQIYYNDVVKIPAEDKTNSYTRPVSPTEIFPPATVPPGSGFQTTLDLHYFPDERGPYNFQASIDKVDASGKFIHPKENWAGVMADMKMNADFEAANVEFIEFWMMSPFMDQFANNTGGDLVFNLGNISEDVLPDNLQSFENGLPANDGNSGMSITPWARVPEAIPAANAFSNNVDDRKFQDVGLDGYRDDLERDTFKTYVEAIKQNFGATSAAYTQATTDPSSDNFVHFFGDEFGSNTVGILDRFKNFNGTENNSPVNSQTASGLTRQGTPYPDTEDLNKNGTPNTWEEYWEYKISLRPNDLAPGRNYVVDSIRSYTRDNRNNIVDEVTWYQFRIPLKNGRAVNNIPNFKVINFLRMYMTGFEQEHIVRLTDFQMVSTQWRRYTGPLLDPPGPSIDPNEPPFSTLDVGSVSLQENSQKLPFNYVTPPGIIRQGIAGNTSQTILQDERSLLMKTCGIKDGEGQAIFKNVAQDFRNYKDLRMWVHAEAREQDGPSHFNKTGDAVLFIRLGLDNDYNYYEYEYPLTPSDLLKGQDTFNIWANNIVFELAKLTTAKIARDNAGFPNGDRFLYTQDLPQGHRIFIKGTPKISDVHTIMIGVRNPVTPNEGPICLELWLNELRLSNFDQTAAWAANANVNLQLADLGSVQGTLQYRQAGFGPLEQKLSQRTREDKLRYSVMGDFMLGKFFPQKWGINLPVHANYDEQINTPVFDPRQADVKTKDLTFNNKQQKDSTLAAILDVTRSRGISLNNIKKNKSPDSKKAYPWDISNFDASFSYSDQFSRNYLIEKKYATTHRAALNYRYSIKSANIQPFKKWKKKNPISEFNFSPLPKQFSVSILGDRQFTENTLRATGYGGYTPTIYTKNFLITRNYQMAWDLTKNLIMTFNAANNSRVDEVKGYWDSATQQERDSVGSLGDNLFHIGKDSVGSRYFDQTIHMGRTIGYNHNVNLQYNLPLKNYKWTDWINGNGSYTANFQWLNPPENNTGLGATASNKRDIQANGSMNLRQFYNKSKTIKKLLEVQAKTPPPPAKGGTIKNDKSMKEVEEGESKGKDDKTKPKKEDPKKAPIKINPDWKDKHKLHPPKELKILKAIIRSVVRLILSVQKVDANYTENSTTVLPGYMPRTDNFGADFGYKDQITGIVSPVLPPSLGFAFGDQKDIRGAASRNYWVSRDSTLSNYFAHTKNSQLTLKSSLEPMPGMTIDLTANRSSLENFSEMFRWSDNSSGGDYRFTDQQSTGNFTCSYVFLGSAFEGNDTISKAFDRFSAYRQILSQRLAAANPSQGTLQYTGEIIDSVGNRYMNGYSGTSQDVLIPSLLAGYGVINPNKIETSPFPKMPLPNWSVNFNPMIAFPAMKKVFSNFSIKHSYRGSYTVGAFTRNIYAQDFDGDGLADNTRFMALDKNGQSIENFNATKNIQMVQFTEQMSPLIGINFTTKNGITGNIAYNRQRQMSFNMGNLQLTENKTQDFSITGGWRKDKLNLDLHILGKNITLKNTLEVKVQVSMRDNFERNRTLDGLPSNPLRGQVNWNINPYIDYVISNRLSIKAFWQQTINNPHTSLTYKTSFRSAGVQLRFSLQ